MIFNIQRYSTHDGPGIRTVVFLKGCSLRCRWCQNPESYYDKAELLYDKRLCINDCQLCVQKLPHRLAKHNQQLEIDYSNLSQLEVTQLTDICPSLALTVCGRDETIADIMTIIDKDAIYYQRSQGGVTLSGGEPFMQAKLVQSLTSACKKQGYHTAIETCLHVPWHYIKPALATIDLFLADLKHINENKFYQWTQGSAKRVMDNLTKLATENKETIIRIPLIPEFNADRTTIKQLIDFISDYSSANEVHFLPYHSLGAHKYTLLGRHYTLTMKPLDDAELFEFALDYANEKQLKAMLRG